MKKFEILEHTADLRATVYGNNIAELFLNAAELLYFLVDADLRAASGRTENIKIDLSGDSQENLLVRFLNELIYIAEVKKVAGSVMLRTLVTGGECGNRISFELVNCKIVKSVGREIKSATYHNLRIRKFSGCVRASIIFDV